MRNRNNKYFSPSSFEQILNNGEIEELLHILAVTGQTSYLDCQSTTARKLYHERTTRLIKTVLTCSVRGVHYMMTIGYKTTKELHILRN